MKYSRKWGLKVTKRKNVCFLLSFALIASLLGILTNINNASCQVAAEYFFEIAFPNLAFDKPIGIYPAPTGDNRLFVIEQDGKVKVFNSIKNVDVSTVFLDISNRVVATGEQGLLGLAFHPNFSQTSYVYVNYIAANPLRTVIARFTVSPSNPDIADPNTMTTIMEYHQPFSNHKGGQLTFGPDGYLYIGVGDGGGAGDPLRNGQNLSTVLGKILRINVDAASVGRNYSIPSDNPFFGNNLGYREEIYAYGFRNPWRFSFDSTSGQLWVGDVGQDRLEEIDIVEKGKNYGWNIMEGSLCFDPASGCNQTGLELPIWNYTHNLGYSVIGGYVYRGLNLSTLVGDYVYADYGSGRIWALKFNGTMATNTLLTNTGINIASLGLDARNELYFTAYNGRIYQLTSTAIPEYPTVTAVIVILVTITITGIFVKKKRKRPYSSD